MYQNNEYKKVDIKKRGLLKTNKTSAKNAFFTTNSLKKPEWIKVKTSFNEDVLNIKKIIRKNKLHTVCEEALCPNLGECFSKGTATFMIMGDVCTRRCPFCDIAHGKPLPLEQNEPDNLAKAIKLMQLKYAVITSVDRDDLLDRGAGHFVSCIKKIRKTSPNTKIEILVPDFRNKIEKAIEILQQSPPDVFNHNLETVPSLYLKARPGANYKQSLSLIKLFKQNNPNIITKSGIMLGLGETFVEVKLLLRELKEHDCDMVTIGQYLRPSLYHLPVERYINPSEFDEIGEYAIKLGFYHVASAPMVRSSYHADLQYQKQS